MRFKIVRKEDDNASFRHLLNSLHGLQNAGFGGIRSTGGGSRFPGVMVPAPVDQGGEDGQEHEGDEEGVARRVQRSVPVHLSCLANTVNKNEYDA